MLTDKIMTITNKSQQKELERILDNLEYLLDDIIENRNQNETVSAHTALEYIQSYFDLYISLYIDTWRSYT